MEREEEEEYGEPRRASRVDGIIWVWWRWEGARTIQVPRPARKGKGKGKERAKGSLSNPSNSPISEAHVAEPENSCETRQNPPHSSTTPVGELLPGASLCLFTSLVMRWTSHRHTHRLPGCWMLGFISATDYVAVPYFGREGLTVGGQSYGACVVSCHDPRKRGPGAGRQVDRTGHRSSNPASERRLEARRSGTTAAWASSSPPVRVDFCYRLRIIRRLCMMMRGWTGTHSE